MKPTLGVERLERQKVKFRTASNNLQIPNSDGNTIGRSYAKARGAVFSCSPTTSRKAKPTAKPKRETPSRILLQSVALHKTIALV
jgi:hypothetical protein